MENFKNVSIAENYCNIKVPTDRETNGGTTLEEQNANEPEVEVKSTEKIDSLTDCTSISSYPSVKLKGSDPPDLKEYSSPLQAFTARFVTFSSFFKQLIE